MKTIKKVSEDDCGCGKPLKVTDPQRKKVDVKKTIPKKNFLK